MRDSERGDHQEQPTPGTAEQQQSNEEQEVIGTDQELIGEIVAAGKETGEKFWQLPLDKEYSKQWNLYNNKDRADISAQEAWEVTTGGIDRNGNDIVVAIVDGGVDISHPDLQDNIWTNPKEIPAIPPAFANFNSS